MNDRTIISACGGGMLTVSIVGLILFGLGYPFGLAAQVAAAIPGFALMVWVDYRARRSDT